MTVFHHVFKKHNMNLRQLVPERTMEFFNWREIILGAKQRGPGSYFLSSCSTYSSLCYLFHQQATPDLELYALFPHRMYSHRTPWAQKPELQPSLLEPLRLCTAVPTNTTQQLGHHRAPQKQTARQQPELGRALKSVW